ncbi:mitochondrial-processing peptidase subunit alpha-like [Frieseomelitta varia]|uniref:mitochondrial-processing peptidase subunit alpha-like n=1 Tax=Frieseomelitta varia TaxID=561572 RepID=UPI001CB6B0B3|nr:mitochondrial-processing peptidase subunit alpha-like [Frieseomelitta varia]XP_043518602.1 mitochondrial-processing peptidase subunit alpha-like [Frieseomelitta varia]XP_043518603.1 mitochondrial-processing peptidase subunit alpha-like [Frieseomelitta varia]XP_043518604.1 mitochondrial-processing peptidase subunit alpha-like [Frieseomelitta varia]XP_043518605.1 mitochondrial-processing peptidase subunit alpha-like [Frieseomelitta varia]
MLALEKHGGMCDCQASRNAFEYAASSWFGYCCTNSGLYFFEDQITQEEMNAARQRFELESLLTRPEMELILKDMIHVDKRQQDRNH